MLENITKVERWLGLIAYLVGRHFPVPVEEVRGYRISKSDFYLLYLKLLSGKKLGAGPGEKTPH